MIEIENKEYKRYLFIIPLILFIVDYLLIRYGMMEIIDKYVYQFTQILNCELMTNFFKLCSFLGSTYFYVTMILILIILKSRKDLYTGIHLLIVQGINRIIKFMVKRARPPKIYHLVVETNYSFPSGHSMSAMAGYGLFIIELKNSQCKYKNILMIFCGVMIFLIGLSRIYLGVHYFSDVIGGYLISLGYLLFVYYNTSFYA